VNLANKKTDIAEKVFVEFAFLVSVVDSCEDDYLKSVLESHIKSAADSFAFGII
jgi:hypothetical protein